MRWAKSLMKTDIQNCCLAEWPEKCLNARQLLVCKCHAQSVSTFTHASCTNRIIECIYCTQFGWCEGIRIHTCILYIYACTNQLQLDARCLSIICLHIWPDFKWCQGQPMSQRPTVPPRHSSPGKSSGTTTRPPWFEAEFQLIGTDDWFISHCRSEVHLSSILEGAHIWLGTPKPFQKRGHFEEASAWGFA